MGSRMPVEDCLARNDTPMRMGSSITTMGVLLRKALQMAPTSRVARNDSLGLALHVRARKAASGRSAPVVSMPLPTIMSAQMVMSASWPKPAKNSDTCSVPPSR